MKYFVLLITLIISLLATTLFVLKTSQKSKVNKDDSHGCIIKEGEDECCWENGDSCCEPFTTADIKCATVITNCCKTKYYDEETKTYKYQYSGEIKK